MKSALHKVQAEAQEEIKRQSESYLRQQREQKEVISKLQVILNSSYSLILNSCFLHRTFNNLPLLFSGIRKRNPFACGNFEVQAGMIFHNDCFESIILLVHYNYFFFVHLMQEDARENLVTSEKKVRELEAQLQDEQLVSANNRKVPSSVPGRLQ